MNIPEKIIERLEDNLIEVDWNECRVLHYIKTAIGICSSALLELRQWINQFNFAFKSEKINFLKVAKPYVLSNCLFHQKLFELEAMLPVITKMAKEKHLRMMIFDSLFFFDRPPEFCLH